MGCTACYAWGDDIDESFFREQADVVIDRLGGVDIDFSIVAVQSPDDCGAAAESVPVDDPVAFQEECRTADTSVSIRSGGEEYIIIRAGRAFIRENAGALRGLLAHEIMHTVQREAGMGETVERIAKDQEDVMIEKLSDAGLSDDEIQRFVYTVFQTAIFAVKDIRANTALIDRGFTADLEEYYRHMIGVDDFCPAPDFYGESADVSEVEDAITFELGLLPAWLPFKHLGREASNEIRDRIAECYETDLPDVAAFVQELEETYTATYYDMDELTAAFMGQVIDRAVTLLTHATTGGDG
ncbi:MAG: hypothetical protein ABEK12_02470 [Candidatus Nanohaloarchaea archaeon]